MQVLGSAQAEVIYKEHFERLSTMNQGKWLDEENGRQRIVNLLEKYADPANSRHGACCRCWPARKAST